MKKIQYQVTNQRFESAGKDSRVDLVLIQKEHVILVLD
jgi:lipopolysaccharide export system protein LptA